MRRDEREVHGLNIGLPLLELPSVPLLLSRLNIVEVFVVVVAVLGGKPEQPEMLEADTGMAEFEAAGEDLPPPLPPLPRPPRRWMLLKPSWGC